MEDGADAHNVEPGQDSASGHKRTKSGGILGGFLRSSSSSSSSKGLTGSSLSAPTGSEGTHGHDDQGAVKGSSMAKALRQTQGGRQRKGSLRKAAMARMRERSSSLRKAAKPSIITTFDKPALNSSPADTTTTAAAAAWVPAIQLPSSPTEPTCASRDVPEPPPPSPPLLASPISPIAASPAAPYASTTDDDDVMSFYRPLAASSDYSSFAVPSQGPVASLAHRRSTRSNRRTSITSLVTPAEIDSDDEWDYSETEWWGWVVLIATWIVFVVGMGSCLGVWSWAWDVGETPYAPPDLEDDATLPITGYYPALIVCTAVTSWVWVVVAWVGMKYFRHAKVGVDG
ncbi:hypothetical protein COCCADRAFT_24899 [Bipolaris zeicola 26-R-13]|uniref:Uncharacterized protein n=1 Tax=Cochliobolus carbonum (strain 26-R-13) TaxID=930089 RepID=W6YBX9_COCC2|nr:uncharacterized protein COCCADRAFT_24899 [Bipolaris zeicola 26-R-13]EUC35130.1 hypothetical protein COCCADRAFT_24899 [Bipolaris zeicola 26-R-13]